MPFNLLLFPLLSGFVFVTFWNRTKLRAVRYEGYRLVLYSSIWGAIFLFSSILLLKLPYLGDFIEQVLHTLFDPYPSTYDGFNLTVLSFLVGSIAWYPLNLLIFKRDREYRQAVKIFGSRLEKLLLQAITENSMISVTLRNRKIYIGYVIEDINPEKDRAFLTIFPMLSGYRDSETLEFKLTTNYVEIYKNLMEDPDLQAGRNRIVEVYDFRICVGASDIVSVNGYDPSIHESFEQNRKRASVDSSN